VLHPSLFLKERRKEGRKEGKKEGRKETLAPSSKPYFRFNGCCSSDIVKLVLGVAPYKILTSA